MYEYYHNESARSQFYRQPPDAPGSQPFGMPGGFPGFSPGSQFGPGLGPPQGVPGGPPSTSPGASSGPPSGPPPSFTPQQTQAQGPSLYAVDPGAIRPCTFRYVYIWLNTGERFWAWLVFVGRRSAAGWRWTGFRWIYFGVDLRNIESFTCY